MTSVAYPGVQLSWRRVLAIAQNLPDPAAEIDFEDQIELDTLPQGQYASMSPYLSRLHCIGRALHNMFTITGHDEGYTAFITTMTTELKSDCPIAMAFAKHIIDFSEIPSKAVLRNTSKLFLAQINNIKGDRDLAAITQLSINQNIMWSMLAQKYAGNLIESMWVDHIGDLLIKSLADDSSDLILRLFSLLALESFAMTGSIKEKLVDQYQIVHVLERVLEEVELKLSQIQYAQQQGTLSLSTMSYSPNLTLASVKRHYIAGPKIFEDLKLAFLRSKTKLKRKSLKKRESYPLTIQNVPGNHIGDKCISLASPPTAVMTQPMISESERERDIWFELKKLRHTLCWSLQHVFRMERMQTFDKHPSAKITMPWIHLSQIDCTSHCKLSIDCIEVRNDTHFFESVRANACIANSGRWYYEVLLLTSGVMQIGWGTTKCSLSPQDGSGIGDDRNGFAFDTYRSAIWSAGERIYSRSNAKARCKVGDVLGCLIDLDKETCAFYMNGQDQCLTAGFDRLNLAAGASLLGLFPTISLTGYQHVLVNFGDRPWLFSPPVTNFKPFSETNAIQTFPKTTTVMRESETAEYEWDGPMCTFCFSESKDTMLLPCEHDGFGKNCAEALEVCPLCRAVVKERVASKNNIKI